MLSLFSSTNGIKCKVLFTMFVHTLTQLEASIFLYFRFR